MTCVCRRYDRDIQKNKNGGRSPIENKQLAYFLDLETRISFYIVTTEKNLKYVFMCTIVTSSDMTSFIYIGDEKHHLSKWFGKDKKYDPQQKEIELSLLSD